MKIKIDKRVPLPPKYQDRTVYPWRHMRVGDSFLFPRDRKLEIARRQASRAGRELKRQFIVRETPKGVRCWRVK